jgi:hypothetical protein
MDREQLIDRSMKGADVHSERSGYRQAPTRLPSAYAESMRFSVRVEGKDGEATREALNAAQIPTMGPVSTKFMNSNGPWRVGKDVFAVVDAETAEDAVAVVQAAIDAAESDLTISETREWSLSSGLKR